MEQIYTGAVQPRLRNWDNLARSHNIYHHDIVKDGADYYYPTHLMSRWQRTRRRTFTTDLVSA